VEAVTPKVSPQQPTPISDALAEPDTMPAVGPAPGTDQVLRRRFAYDPLVGDASIERIQPALANTPSPAVASETVPPSPDANMPTKTPDKATMSVSTGAGQIQRQLEPLQTALNEEMSENLEAGDLPDEENDSGSRPPASVDTDELARRVYRTIRSRLAIEWERLRRR
jgi:hypothetical protein